MKVLNLQCGYGHEFEGWFASEGDFRSQLARRLLSCPMCGDTGIVKLPSAPRLNLGGREAAADGNPAAPTPAAAPQEGAARQPSERAQLQGAWLRAVRRIMAETEDVGSRFAEEARRIHYGQADERAIRGQATREQTEQLLDEGIPVLPLPIPASLKEPLQ
ncbi:MAG: DUF1178 family protein [Burkholderiaceae bacterium]|jgi:hypothetical protein|nr:DUF1178 family protein [Burkholderiaceae bacterium]